jgi:eukaryotic-like serine/threonine-protein kinase
MSDQEQSAEDIFGTVIEKPAGQRAAYLVQVCSGSDELRSRVEKLLADYERMGSFLGEPLLGSDSGAFTQSTERSEILNPGHKLGRYTVIEPIGSGGMGSVYRARDEKLERIIAIKILRPGVLTGAEARRRFRMESLALAKLSQPNIAHVHDVGEEDGVDYIVMECVAGQTLAAKLRSGPLTVKEATSIVLQIARALEEAHEQGIIHRDLKPANVMITTRGHVKVLDFGIAKLLAPATTDFTTSITEQGFIVGTPLYMSPEQAQGQEVDARADLWSLGVIYYECLTDCTPFQADSNIAVFHAIVMKEPSPLLELRHDAPSLANAIVLQSLAKDPAARYQSASEIVRDASALIATLSTPSQTWATPAAPSQKIIPAYTYAVALAVLVAAVVGAFFFPRSSSVTPANAQWEQLTFFTDSAVYPALSPDGRMLAFIRGSSAFFGPGQIYVKLLPGGEPVQLTHDSTVKLAPSFSPDNSGIAYGIVDPWDTWEVPVLGGDPHMLLPNSSSLTWIEQGKRVLFSEMREGIHLVVVTSDEGRGDSRDVYVPLGKRSMAHHSYLSPDGRWVLIVEMDPEGNIGPCRVVPFGGTNEVKLVGPPNRPCFSGAWSPDGKWIYLSIGSHIWRQRFPDGQPEQLTFGPTSQWGIAMAPDGKSLITSVGSLDFTVWMHDKAGDHQISSEGNAWSPSFSADGNSLYFLMSDDQTRGEELWIKDLASGNVERMPLNHRVRSYTVSHDGKELAFTTSDQSGPSNLWIAPISRRSPPVRISSAVAEDSPFFLPDGELVFRAVEGGSNYLYRVKTDGSARTKISPERILDIEAVSPDGRWVVATTPGSGDEEHVTMGAVKAFAVDGTAAVTVCVGHCRINWDTSGRFVYFHFRQPQESTLALPLIGDSGLPKTPPVADSIKDFAKDKGISIPSNVESAVTPSVYAYTRQNTRRNLYRIPLP